MSLSEELCEFYGLFLWNKQMHVIHTT
jgi:hypothetical protein